MRHVTGVNDERGFVGHAGDMIQRLLERAGNVRIDRLVEPEMAVAHLGEGKAGFRGLGLADHVGPGNTAGDGPKHRTAGPGHAFQKSAAVRIKEFSGHRRAPLGPDPDGLT